MTTVGLIVRRAAVPFGVVALSLVAACGSSSAATQGSSSSPAPGASATSGAAASSPTSPLALTGAGKPATALTGHWTVASGSVAGYRVNETFVGQSSEAVARTSALSGQTDISGTTASGLHVVADLTQCKGVDSHVDYAGFNRDNVVKTRILNFSQFPNATLDVASITLSSDAASGNPVDVSGQGTFTLKGKTNPVNLKLKGQAEGDQKLEVAGTFAIQLSDYGISVPTVPFTSAGSTGNVEVDLFLQKA
jgi:polyisoprenoid-binding protein YceI